MHLLFSISINKLKNKTMKIVFYSFLTLSLALASCSKSELDSPSPKRDYTQEAITKSAGVEYLYHEETGLLLKNQEDPYRTLDESKATDYAIEFFPKSLEEYWFLSDLSYDGISTSFVPFGYTPVCNMSKAEAGQYKAFPRKVNYTIPHTSKLTNHNEERGGIDVPLPEDSPLPIIYALWPVGKELPEGIEYQKRYWVSLPARIEGPVQQITLPIKIDTYDSKLLSYVPMGVIKVRLTRGSYTADFYTTANGTFNIRPLMLDTSFTLSEIEQFNVSVIYETELYKVSRDSYVTPIQKSLGTVYSLWGSMHYGSFPTYTTHQSSTTTECEVFRAANYYYYGSHAFSSLRLSSENGRIIHVNTPVNTTDYAVTHTYSNDIPTIYVYNNPAYSVDNDCVGSVIHELGHVHHYYIRGGFSQFHAVADLLQESFASYIGWSVGEQYYISKGYVLSYGEHLNWQHRPSWTPYSGYIYSPLFVDLTDDYNQADLTDTITGVPASVVNNMGAQCTTIYQCKNHMSNYVGTYLTTSELNLYFSYYL